MVKGALVASVAVVAAAFVAMVILMIVMMSGATGGMMGGGSNPAAEAAVEGVTQVRQQDFAFAAGEHCRSRRDDCHVDES